MSTNDEPVDAALRRLRDRCLPPDAAREGGADALFERHLQVRRDRARRRRLAAAGLLVFAASGAGAVLGREAIARWFSVRVEMVSRDREGEVESLTVRVDTGHEAVLVPLSRPTMADPEGKVISLPACDELGGALVLEIDGMIPGVTTESYAAVSASSSPEPGQVLEVRRRPRPKLVFTRTDTGAVLGIVDSEGTTSVALRALDQDVRRFTDGVIFVTLKSP